jgi:hypothetical protein
MAKFITIGYGDSAGYERTAPDVRAAAHDHDARLRAAGVLMGVARRPVQVRNTGGDGIETRSGAYMRSDLPVAGFAVIDAPTIDDAVAQVSWTPCAVANGVVEVWPLDVREDPA